MRNTKQFKLNTIKYFRCKYCRHGVSFWIAYLRWWRCNHTWLYKARSQRGRESFRKEVTVFPGHDQMEGSAELWESESTVLVNITQLPEGHRTKMIVSTYAKKQFIACFSRFYHYHICDSSGIGSFDLVKKFFATVPERKTNANFKLSK